LPTIGRGELLLQRHAQIAEPEASRSILGAVSSLQGAFVPLRHHRRHNDEELAVILPDRRPRLAGRARADAALYAAKRAGKHRVAVYRP
jgi:hypothetical protein